MSYQIALDGPAGAGKSTIAKLVAKELNFVYVDTGAMYRAIGLNCLENNIPLEDEDAVTKLTEKTEVTIKYVDGEQAVLLNGRNVNGLIRTPEVGNAASTVAVYKGVRSKNVSLQQEITRTENVIMDGRDIGSVVLPNADLKVYLDADVKVRAKRRYDELVAKGEKVELSVIEDEVRERDYRDMHRDISPLVRVPDAFYVDSSYMSIEEVKDTICRKFKEVIKNA